MLHAVLSQDPIYLLAVPLFLAQARVRQVRYEQARARAMRRHPSHR